MRRLSAAITTLAALSLPMAALAQATSKEPTPRSGSSTTQPPSTGKSNAEDSAKSPATDHSNTGNAGSSGLTSNSGNVSTAPSSGSSKSGEKTK